MTEKLFCTEDYFELDVINTKEDLDHWLVKTDSLISELQSANGEGVSFSFVAVSLSKHHHLPISGRVDKANATEAVD